MAVRAGPSGGGAAGDRTLDFRTERLTLWCGIDIFHWSWSHRGCSGQGGIFPHYRDVSVPYRFGTNNCCDGLDLVEGNLQQASLG
jgi:hypothetical protein